MSESRGPISGKQEDLESRPTLQFISSVTDILIIDTKTTTQLANGEKIRTDVLANIKLLGRTIEDLNAKFRDYEKSHQPEVNIKLKQIVQERQEEADKLEKRLKLIRANHQRTTSELDEKIRLTERDKKEVRRESLVSTVTDINIHTKGVIDVDMLEKRKKEIGKKIDRVCCPCTDKAVEKLDRLHTQQDEYVRQIREAQQSIEQEKKKNTHERDAKEEKQKELMNSIELSRKDLSQHIERGVDTEFAELEPEFARATRHLELAKADYAEAMTNSLKNIGRLQMAALLLIVAQFERFKDSFDALYVAKVMTLDGMKGDEYIRLDAHVKQMATFKEKLKNDLEKLENSFKKFTSSETAVRTASAIYRAYKTLDESLKNKFVEKSFVDETILDQVILPMQAVTVKNDLPSIADNHSTLSTRHSRRNQRSKSDGVNNTASSLVNDTSTSSPNAFQ